MEIVKAIDVADFILSRLGPMSAMKLQKLLYYSQAWCLVWTENALFEEDIQAWTNGPVVRDIYNLHKGFYRLEPGFFKGNPKNLSAAQVEVIESVLKFYGDKDPQWLSELTHMEAPWQNSREGLAEGDRGEKVITKEAMLEYYSSLR
jgi:uncharacterized phage-associated protein